jgi:hypothetical protein
VVIIADGGDNGRRLQRMVAVTTERFYNGWCLERVAFITVAVIAGGGYNGWPGAYSGWLAWVGIPISETGGHVKQQFSEYQGSGGISTPRPS